MLLKSDVKRKVGLATSRATSSSFKKSGNELPMSIGLTCGSITGLNLPGGNGVRIDTAIYEGYTIPPTYDSMIAKIITHGDSRNEAISKMKRALEETVIEGVDTNIDFLFKIIKNPNFIRGNFDTSFIEKEILKK